MSKHSRFYSSLSLLLLLNALIKPVWIFAIDRQVQVLAGNETYGHYFSMLNLSMVFAFAADMGLSPFLNRQLAAAETGNKHLLPLFKIKAGFSMLYLLLVTGAGLLTGIRYWNFLWYVSFIQLFISWFVFLRGIITARQLFRADAWLSVADKTIMIAVCGSFLYLPFINANTLSVLAFLQIQLISILVACLLAGLVIFRHRVETITRNLFRFDKQLWSSLWPFAATVFLMATHNRLDGFMLEQLHPDGAAEAGLYAGAYRLLDVANMGGYLLVSFLFPYITRRHSAGEEVNDVLLQSRHLLISFAVGCITVTAWLAPWWQQLLYHQHDSYAVLVLQWCMPSLIGYSLVNIYGTALSATGHIRLLLYLMAGAVLLNILLNLWLIPERGALGAAWAALISQTILGLATTITALRKATLRLHPSSVFLYAGMALASSLLLYTGLYFSVNKGLLLLLAGLLILILLFVSGILSVKSLYSLINKN